MKKKNSSLPISLLSMVYFSIHFQTCHVTLAVTAMVDARASFAFLAGLAEAAAARFRFDVS
jgi:hypothetical protein